MRQRRRWERRIPDLMSHGRAVVIALLVVGPAVGLGLGMAASATGQPSRAATGSSGGPFTEQGLKLMGVGETSGGAFGHSVAISTDGNTALVGGYEDTQFAGAAWIFTRTPAGWAPQGGKLTPATPSSAPLGDGKFGEAVALSGDGNTALIGEPGDGKYGTGAVCVFTRSGAAWAQQGARLTSGTNSDSFGTSVALSSDGTTALIGSYNSAQVFTRSGATWTQQGPALVGAGATGTAGFGSSVALSSDGNTALVGGRLDNASKGAVWVFTRSGGAWHAGPMLTGSDETGTGQFGGAVALSGDGSTALIGGADDSGNRGATWVFSRTGAAWAPQGPKLVGLGETGNGNFGNSVALSSDGNTAFVGAFADDTDKGGVWVFNRSGGSWHKGQTLIGNENAQTSFGSGVALSGSGDTGLVGGELGQFNGEAWVFAVEAVSGLSPSSGPVSGGVAVKISGSGLTAATAVMFGTRPATLFKVESDTLVSAVAPPGQAGTVDVTVTVPGGATPASSGDRFTYTSPTTTTATTTTTTAPPKGPIARIVRAVVRGAGTTRTLVVRIRVSEQATARLVLLVHGKQRLAQTFQVAGGSNTLKAPLPATFPKSTARLTIVLTDRKHRRSRYSVTLSVPA